MNNFQDPIHRHCVQPERPRRSPAGHDCPGGPIGHDPARFLATAFEAQFGGPRMPPGPSRGPPPHQGPPEGPGPHHCPPPGPPGGLKDTPVKGLLHLAILDLVSAEQTYGSEIHRNLKDKFGIDEQKPVIYGLLRRMEDMDLLSSKWDTEGGGPARRVYVITEDGVEHLEEALEGLKKAKSVIDVLLQRSGK